ncbi:amino acid/amide ABC transporter substrate-binding protein (HAAT family) [Micromonospora pisi]|uniref:Amino acid/amide ABC transporter substrate-binding protein (HAAT family) n=1 Tax=Micromonospora pisi TaxID=589240 RepID=A0A495JIH9_9ACTN|nr:ABC transporter substrate-binding protein [Micromonospora pisi]RKR88601.1 amino acid/amide ABC transporter substrate-binding protein (HAAT family) [Micromonospora pisi]
MARPAIGSSSLTRRGLLVASASSLFLTACGSGDSEVQSGPTRGPQDLVIGANLELTGAGAAMGVLQERALRITVDTLNEEGIQVGNARRKIRLVVQDNGSDPKKAAEQAAELVEREQANAIIGGTIAETSMEIIKVAQQGQLPFISLAAADELVVPLTQRDFIYKLTPDATDVARQLARLISSQKLRKVTLLAAPGLHGNSGVRAVTQSLKTSGVQLAKTLRLPATGADLGSIADRTVSSKADAVVVWATAPTSGATARALRDAGYQGPIFFDAGAVAEETLSDQNADAVEGAFVVHPMALSGSSLTNTTSAGLARRDFVFRYIQAHGSFSGFAPYASDAVQLIAAAARLANSVDRGRIRVYLARQVTEGIAGSYAFAPIRHGGMEPDSLGVFTVSRGEWTRIS